MSKITSYDRRDTNQKLFLPKARTDYLKRSYFYSGAILWDNLPKELRTANSVGLFERVINKWFSVSGIPHAYL